MFLLELLSPGTRLPREVDDEDFVKVRQLQVTIVQVEVGHAAYEVYQRLQLSEEDVDLSKKF